MIILIIWNGNYVRFPLFVEVCIEAYWCLVGTGNETSQTLYNMGAKIKRSQKIRAEHPSCESKSDTRPLPSAESLQQRYKYDSIEM
jgi:hypothetical protein